MISTQVSFILHFRAYSNAYKLRSNYLSNFFFSIIHVVKTKLVDNGGLFGQFFSHSRAGYLHSYLIVLKLNLLMLNYFLNFKVISKTLWESLIQRKLKKRKCYKSSECSIRNKHKQKQTTEICQSSSENKTIFAVMRKLS